MRLAIALCALAASVGALIAPTAFPKALVTSPTTAAAGESLVALEACRRNTKKEKRQRNQENMRKYKKGAPPGRGAGGKKKSLSRKRLTLKAQATKEKARESVFMSKLFLATGGVSTEKLDLGVL